jgi:hypothetical protein
MRKLPSETPLENVKKKNKARGSRKSTGLVERPNKQRCWVFIPSRKTVVVNEPGMGETSPSTGLHQGHASAAGSCVLEGFDVDGFPLGPPISIQPCSLQVLLLSFLLLPTMLLTIVPRTMAVTATAKNPGLQSLRLLQFPV